MKPTSAEKVEETLRRYRAGKDEILKETNEHKRSTMIWKFLDGFTYEELQIIVTHIVLKKMS